MGPVDPSGFGRLARTTGVGRIVAILGLLLMLGGLGIFGFAILSVFQAIRSGAMDGPPPAMIYGFGIAIVGAILYQVGLAVGVPRDLEDAPYRPHRSIEIHDSPGTIVDSPVGGNLEINVTINQVRLEWVEYLDRSLDDLNFLPKGARQAMADVRDGVDAELPEQQVGSRLEQLTRILVEGGALAGAAGTVVQAITGLANTLGPYGAGALRALGIG